MKTVRVIEVPGIGANSAALLQKFGVQTAYDYVQRPQAWAAKLLGKPGFELWLELRGECVYPVETSAKPKTSIHKCRTFKPSNDKNILLAEWKENLETCMRKIRRCGMRAQSFLIHARDEHFISSGVEVKLARPTSSSREAGLLLQEFFLKLVQENKKYRQMGVALFDLSNENQKQFELFEDRQSVQKSARLDRTLDEILKEQGRNSIFPATRLFLPKDNRHRSSRPNLPFLKISV